LTKYGWDASNHDWGRGPMDLAKARSEGISVFTHKSSEGNTYLDPNFRNAMDRARSVNFSVLGPYHVLWPLNPVSQADDWYAKVEQNAPWWREHPCWIWQIDAELFQNFSPYRQPTVAEINSCGDRIVARTGCKPSQVVVYAPEWLYDGGLGGLKYRNLWASNYVPGSGGFKQLYPGDSSTRWHAYSGITPIVLQYTSSATIAGQAPADANGIIVATDADLQALFLGDDMTYSQWPDADKKAMTNDVANRLLSDVLGITGGAPLGKRLLRMSNRISAILPGSRKGDDVDNGPIDRNEFFAGLAQANEFPRINANGAVDYSVPATLGGQMAYVDSRIQDMVGDYATAEDITAINSRLDAQQAQLEVIAAAIKNMQLGAPVKYTLTSTGELTPEAPTP
jgi:hypothetical protein